MKLAIFVCMALLAVLLEMAPPVLPVGTRVNGRPAAPRQFPYMAFLHATNDSGEDSTWCMGSLITRSAVLTTASCVYNRTTYTVRLGSIYREANDTNDWTVVSMWALVHPTYNSKNFDNNIAIIHLPREAPLNDYIQLVDLPSSPNVGSFVGYDGIVSGWGKSQPGSVFSEVLHYGEVIVISNDVCKKFFSGDVTDRRVCAGNQYVMDGDDGAPLVVKIKDRYLQIGIHCRRGSHNPSHPALYERVSSYIEWIKERTGAN